MNNNTDNRTIRFTLRMTQDEIDELDRLAQSMRRKRSGAVREAIRLAAQDIQSKERRGFSLRDQITRSNPNLRFFGDTD